MDNQDRGVVIEGLAPTEHSSYLVHCVLNSRSLAPKELRSLEISDEKASQATCVRRNGQQLWRVAGRWCEDPDSAGSCRGPITRTLSCDTGESMMISATDGNDLPLQFSVDRDTFYIFRDTDEWEWKGTFLTTDGFVRFELAMDPCLFGKRTSCANPFTNTPEKGSRPTPIYRAGQVVNITECTCGASTLIDGYSHWVMGVVALLLVLNRM